MGVKGGAEIKSELKALPSPTPPSPHPIDAHTYTNFPPPPTPYPPTHPHFFLTLTGKQHVALADHSVKSATGGSTVIVIDQDGDTDWSYRFRPINIHVGGAR